MSTMITMTMIILSALYGIITNNHFIVCLIYLFILSTVVRKDNKVSQLDDNVKIIYT